MSEIIVAILGLLGTIGIAVLGLYGARRYNIGPNQDKLIDILQDTVSAQNDRISQLEVADKDKNVRILLLNEEVARLTKLTLGQLMRIQELELELQAERRNRNV